ncbi:xanthine dehydrogenase family protein molybdopterin-binding subunit [Nocardioides sp.]|uniref:xanthine dehydrogenase family protein molybdopterin-binding subunit n=1 Tax=Nocardioides sp. TaxID=35761 RepID=UPI003784D84C
MGIPSPDGARPPWSSGLRLEDGPLVDGTGQFFDDLVVPGVLYLHFVRSPVAHALVQHVDVSAARSMTDVVVAYRASDLDLPPFQTWTKTSNLFARPPVAVDRVRFVGDIIAVVVARTRSAAVDAAEVVDYDLEDLDVVVDVLDALRPDAPHLFPDAGGNTCYEVSIGDDDPVASADRVIELSMRSQRLAGVPMECNGILVRPADGGRFDIQIPSQNPLVVQNELARATNLELSRLDVAAPHVGGGFGPKSHSYPEYAIALEVCRRLGQPIKWTETRSENMLSLTQGRDVLLSGRLGITHDGRMQGLDVDITTNAGAYPALGAYLLKMTAQMMQGVYAIPRIRVRGRSVATNTTPTGPYRGAGRPEAAQLLERLVDLTAQELGVDPAELRRLNFLRASDFPVVTRTGADYDSGAYEEALDQVLTLADYDDLRRTQESMRAQTTTRAMGVGIASYVEVTAPDGNHREYGALRICSDGVVEATVGTSAHGQGHWTVFGGIIASVLGVAPEGVRLLQSDTRHVPRGVGTFGSRSLQTAGSALYLASHQLVEVARELISEKCHVDRAVVELRGDSFHIAGQNDVWSWSDVAEAFGSSGRLSCEVDFDGTESTYPFGSHVAVVEVDLETGKVDLVRHFAVDDCGIIANPLIVAGQQMGGIAQGVAQALFEEVTYDAVGNPLSGNLMDYGIPSAADLPAFSVSNTVTPSPRNPLGAKGIGESGTIGATPAVHNAVIDALAPLGVTHIDMPLTPLRVWTAIQAAREASPTGPQSDRRHSDPHSDERELS